MLQPHSPRMTNAVSQPLRGLPRPEVSLVREGPHRAGPGAALLRVAAASDPPGDSGADRGPSGSAAGASEKGERNKEGTGK